MNLMSLLMKKLEKLFRLFHQKLNPISILISQYIVICSMKLKINGIVLLIFLRSMTLITHLLGNTNNFLGIENDFGVVIQGWQSIQLPTFTQIRMFFFFKKLT